MCAVQSATDLTALFRRHVDGLLFPVAFDLTITPDETTDIRNTVHTSDPSDQDAFYRTTVFPDGPTVQSLHSTLFHLENAVDTAKFDISWTDRSGADHETTCSVSFEQRSAEWFESGIIRRLLVLYRYFRALQSWYRRGSDSTNAEHRITAQSPTTVVERTKAYLRDQQQHIYCDQFDRDIDILAAICSE